MVQNFKYFEQNQTWRSKLSDTYLNQKQPFTGVYSRLQKKAYSWVSFFFTTVADLLPKNVSIRDAFQWVCLIIPNSFLQNPFGWWLLLLNTIHFLFCVDFISKMLLSTLARFWLSFNISRANTVSRLLTAAPGSSRQVGDFCW